MATVLVVDDEKSIRTTFLTFLQRAGYEVDIASEAEHALRLLDEKAFDVVLSDILMPGLSGVELLANIRSIAPDIPVIMMTGNPTLETASYSVREGAFEYLTKPVTKDILLMAVDRAAQVKQLRDENRRYQEHLEDLVRLRSEALVRSEMRLRTIINHVPTGIFITDCETGRIQDINPVAAQILGGAKSHLIGRVASEFIHPSPLAAPEQGAERHVTENEECFITTSGGARIPVLRTVVKTKIEDRDCLIECIVDISQQKETERKLREATERAEKISKGKSALLSMVSHELRTPLNGILGMSELLLDVPGVDSVREEVLMIHASGKDLFKTLESLAELAQAEMNLEGDFPLQDFKPARLFQTVERKWSEAAAQKQLEFTPSFGFPDTPLFDAHASQILRVVECLMDNAVKFTASGFVRLSAHLVQSADRDWRFVASIADSGPGIPADQLHGLFEPFGTLDSSNTRTTRGLGLGLAICQRIGRAIGGELKVDSTPGKGSTFHFSCPVYPKQ